MVYLMRLRCRLLRRFLPSDWYVGIPGRLVPSESVEVVAERELEERELVEEERLW